MSPSASRPIIPLAPSTAAASRRSPPGASRRSGSASSATSRLLPCLLLPLAVLLASPPTARAQHYAQNPPPEALREQRVSQHREGGTRCYDDAGRPQRCIPTFENAAFKAEVEATNTCGMDGPTEYCVQTGIGGGGWGGGWSGSPVGRKTCEFCDARTPAYAHPASQLTDFNNNDNQTWWQSETMYEDIQYPSQVNLTLKLGKAFDITYVRLWFYSPRPESFAIYKRTSENSEWEPYQFYSATCRDTYGLPDTNYARRGEETRALCTSEYSDISPLTGGNVAFSTLEGRPSAYNFDTSPELQEWVTATDIKITLDRLNTFGDEVFEDALVLRSYFYAISDFAVGARCKCNGHASECVNSTGVNGESRRVCRCEHNTAGPDCNECLSFYNDAPWARASAADAHECRPCNCNGFSNRCYFDKSLYERTGHGGHCLDCTGFRDGANCERCRDNYYQRADGYCVACNCDPTGSRSLQCNREGKCQCKPGVTGEKCDRCEVNHYDFGDRGCKPCGCVEAGCISNQPRCDPYSGSCQCKDHVEGKRCDSCKPGFFNLDLENRFGCTPCFCYGHSSNCQSAAGYSQVVIESVFTRGLEHWTAEDYSGRSTKLQYNGVTQTVGVSSSGREPVYFLAPERYLGDKRASYNRDLSFKLRIGETGPSPTVRDVILEGEGLSVTQTIFGQGNKLPSVKSQEFVFRLHEHQDYGWQPKLTAQDFMSVLSNLTAIKIRGSYTPEGVGFLDDVRLETARRGAAGKQATWIETCNCSLGYVGQFCESCAPGYRHEPANGGPFARCVPCNCNGHAEICEAETGRCICQDHTMGDNCEQCARGYYGNALQGTAFDCKLCPCPNRGPCIQMPSETVVCLECPKGYGGPKCNLCSDGYYGDPTGSFGPVRACQPCDCNTNVDPNAVGNCNKTTGECLKCIYHTGGKLCDQCLPGYYGDALALPKNDCKECQCYSVGTEEADNGPLICDQLSGQCQCKPHVKGTNCDQCEPGYYNIRSGEGCQPCNCDTVGSLNHTCDIVTGQCMCREGVTGQRCDDCEPYHYGFSSEGCLPCECDTIGSIGFQCDTFGQCPCKENVEGRRCDYCKENTQNRQRGCIDCPPCYDLVQSAANEHRAKLAELKKLLLDIENNPTVIEDATFEERLNGVQQLVNDLWDDAKRGSKSGDKSLSERLEELSKQLDEVMEMLTEAEKERENVLINTEQGERNASLADEAIERLREALKNARDLVETEGMEALSKAKERSDKFGQQNREMSEIAREARLKVMELEDNVKEIQEIAEGALKASTEAIELARNTFNQQKNISDELGVLSDELDAAADKLNATKALAENVNRRAGEVNQEALNIYRDVYSLSVPEIDLQEIKYDAEIVAKNASQIKTDVNYVRELQKVLIGRLEDAGNTGKELLAQADMQQQIADELLADVDAAKGKAEKAILRGDDTLEEAERTYKTLQEFDNEVQESREKAEKSLQMFGEIDRLINEAKNKTGEAERALFGAVNNAQAARDTAQEAQKKFAEQASEEADLIRKDSEETKKNAERVRDGADELAAEVALTGEKLKKLEDQAKENEELTSEAKEKVGQAKSHASEAAKKVEKALGEVQDILRELSGLPDLDEEELNNLEVRLAAAEEEFAKANLDKRMEELRANKLQQSQHLKDYQEEVARLRAEVMNIEDIKKALPPGCWKRLKLEP
ncbi:laminin subunit gamma-1 [Hetaerina americana]|uniref:laminin subunit gamma-1 n=1 Tax=Hetaerina americana TaxID=62018 RepID=UPI003A7F3E15